MMNKTNVIKNPVVKNALCYFIKVLFLLVALTLMGKFAPIFPAVVFPFIFLAYALPATIGSIYDIVINRLHRQYKYNKNGTLSYYNRRWFIWLTGLFVLSLVSAVLFTLSAPTWDDAEWTLIWIAGFAYYALFLITQHFCKKEYAPLFYKASAIKWSLFITVILLCIIYALISTAGELTNLSFEFRDAIQNRYLPFEQSPCVLLSELDKLSSYMNFLTKYGLEQIMTQSYAIAIIVKIVLSASVFFGLVSQFGCCLLNKQEIKSEFQLLPTAGRIEQNNPIQKKYLLTITAIWLVLSAVFLFMNSEAEKVRTSDEYTIVDQYLQRTTSVIVLATNKDFDKIEDILSKDEAITELKNRIIQERNNLIANQGESLKEEINSYYTECAGNTDSYLEWHNGFFGGVAKFIKPFFEGMAIDEFNKRVIDPVDKSPLESKYAAYIEELKLLYSDFQNQIQDIDPDSFGRASVEERFADVATSIDLWPQLSSESKSSVAQDILLNTDSDTNSENTKAKITEFIDSERDEALAMLDRVNQLIS